MNQKLEDYLKGFGSVAIALSGGLDSSVLLALAVKILGAKNCLAINASTPYMMKSELDESETLAKKLNVKFIRLQVPIIDSIKNNPKDRCYLCKKNLFENFLKIATKEGFNALADGSNADDISDYRPGMKAVKELGIISPFLELGLGKREIRQYAKELGLDCADKPAYACLLTRLEHNAIVKEEDLRLIDNAENFLREIGFANVRVRKHGSCARIEVPSEQIKKFFDEKLLDEIDKKLKLMGFVFVSMDIRGYSRGNMNS